MVAYKYIWIIANWPRIEALTNFFSKLLMSNVCIYIDLCKRGAEILSTMQEIRDNASSIEFPLITLQGTEDEFVNPEGAKYLHQHVSAGDKTLHLYEGAYNQLLMDNCREQVFHDLINWMDERISTPWPY
jgi:esterase/lipase